LLKTQRFLCTPTFLQGYNGKDLPLIQQDKVCWQNHLLGGWTIQQWRSNIDDCSPTAVEFNLCPGDDEGTRPFSALSHVFSYFSGNAGPYGAALLNVSQEFQQPFKFESRSIAIAGRTTIMEVKCVSAICCAYVIVSLLCTYF
jgi:hypothetical protein